MSAVDVACFGELLWDFFEEEKGHCRRELGGASANVAVALARVGVKAAAAGGVGDDRMGKALAAQLEAEKVDVTGVSFVKGARTGITFVSREASGEASFVPYRTGTADLVLAEPKTAAAKAKWLVVSSTSMAPTARAATEKMLAAAVKAKTGIVFDLNARAHLWNDDEALREACAALAAQATIVKASLRDLAAVAGKRGMSWLEEHAKGVTWVLTRGDNGAAAVGPHGQATAPTKRVRCIDSTGAGDAFVAGVLSVIVKAGAKPGTPAFADPKLWTRALEVGHMLGAKAVSAVGATGGLVVLDEAKARIGGSKK